MALVSDDLTKFDWSKNTNLKGQNGYRTFHKLQNEHFISIDPQQIGTNSVNQRDL